MSQQVSGEQGSGEVLVYTLGPGEERTLETIAFTVATDGTAGTHAVRLLLDVPTVGTIARLDDLNIGGPGQTNFYTYGLGLNASACTLPNGIAVTDALPWTDLPPGATITLRAIDGAGAEIAGDAFSGVLLQLSGSGAPVRPADNLPLYLLPGSAAA